MEVKLLIGLLGFILIRLMARALLFYRKLNMPFWKGATPFLGYLLLGKQTLSRNHCLSNLLCMGVGLGFLGGVAIWQYYQNMLTLTHAYGIILGNYTVPDYSIPWTVLMTLGAVAILAGMVYRFLILKRIMACFGTSSVLMLILGMIEPTLFYLALTMSTHNYLLNKREKDMSREEFMMYCALRDGQ